MKSRRQRALRGPGGARKGAGERRLVIVESPAKARTIGGYLGDGDRVMATRGHVRDLPAKAGSVQPDEGFAMAFETGRGAVRTLGAMAKALAKSGTLVLATDPDREGEAIAWQVLDWLRERDALGQRTVERVAFREVTPAAVAAALARPRDIDMDLVHAWQARRALDYLVGYGLSPVLWRKLPGCRSAGRVQSVALRLICEREAEIEAFAPRVSWTVEADLAAADGETPLPDGTPLPAGTPGGGAAFTAVLARLDGQEIGDAGLEGERAAREAAARIGAARFRVASVAHDVLRRAPVPPFTTSTLQQEAARTLGFGIGETMEIAQRLYEGVEFGGGAAGLITYMRTDLTVLAKTAVAAARRVIRERFGADCLPAKPRLHRSRADTSGNLQEAHEAIRPTDFAHTPEAVEARLGRGAPGRGGAPRDRAAAALYGLIWRRAVASQMMDARFDRVRVEIASEGGGPVLAAAGSALAFDGHLRAWEDGGDGAGHMGDTGRLPALAAGDRVSVLAARAERHVSEPPPRYTEAGLVRRLEELGIGRPSTWAAILAVLQERDYAVLYERRFVATERGRVRSSSPRPRSTLASPRRFCSCLKSVCASV